ncbi:MarR family winged helix-turn-helix transcriptional regulator [Asticcacaulis sp. ZE23SCel15]|uniref:MarR family winged helix-turn-helix transcriptional regulator n=1 Tax=Asticcacaulis sp. ZE23SCel15 TaxID=3059027 RepID=UPI00265F13B0|nr:MarR family winged helix-turn-helix transcriptional regulator [Asticcacaulis sp. ZE23SCel15]WKL57968.1 MarR family winged helix-turn-helix transcriptional regulator [Asticcacaulis sp. ZE23SCel15]
MKKHKVKRVMSAKSVLENSPSHLLHRVLQIALDIYGSETGGSALTQRQYALLKALDGSEGLTQTDLVRATGIDRSTLADMVARMITKGLLAREKSVLDARANLVRLADDGVAALADMTPKVLAADEKILSLLAPPKRDSFVKLLRKITSARETELSAPAPLSDEEKLALKATKKAAKADKPKKDKKPKKDGKKAKKTDEKLPFPPLSEGADMTQAEAPELVKEPEV